MYMFSMLNMLYHHYLSDLFCLLFDKTYIRPEGLINRMCEYLQGTSCEISAFLL